MQQETTPSASSRPGTETTTPSNLHLINMAATTPAEVALRLQTVKYTKMAGLAVLVFDYCIKLGDEIYLTWGRKWGFVRILFVMARYMPFVYISMDLLYSLGPNSPRHCLFIYQVSSWVNIIDTAAAEALLLVRTYTLWGRSRMLLVTLLIVAMGCLAGSGAVGANALSSFNYQRPPLGTSGCHQTHRIEIFAFDFALLGFYEMVILSLSIFQVWYHRRGPGSNLLIRLYWDGIIYVACILAISTANIVVINALPTEYAGSMRTLQAVLHSTLSSRLLFNLRNIMQHQREGTIDTSPQTTIRFQCDIPLYSKDITQSH